jgi:hypothetical protein
LFLVIERDKHERHRQWRIPQLSRNFEKDADTSCIVAGRRTRRLAIVVRADDDVPRIGSRTGNDVSAVVPEILKLNVVSKLA